MGINAIGCNHPHYVKHGRTDKRVQRYDCLVCGVRFQKVTNPRAEVKISENQFDILRQSYDAGLTRVLAASLARVNKNTVTRYYRRFTIK